MRSAGFGRFRRLVRIITGRYRVIANIDHGSLQCVRPDSCFRPVAIESLQSLSRCPKRLRLLNELTGSDLERMPSSAGQRRIYKERASWHDLPSAGSPTLIANLARLRQTSSPASKFPACDFSAPEGGSASPFVLRAHRLWAIESAQRGAVAP